MSTFKSSSLVLFLLTFVCLPFNIFAQSSTATLSGTVEDQNGAAIPAVAVSVENVGTRIKREVVTNASGYFTVPLLPPGEYTVMARANGFAAVQIPAVILNVGDQKSLQIGMKIGDVNAQIEVRPDETLVTTKSDVSSVIDRNTIENIPLNGRSFQTLFELTPGVTIVPSGAGGGGGQFSVNGQRTNANYVTVDGTSANTGIIGGPNFLPGQSASGTSVGYTAQGTTASLVAVDALQEFRIQTSTFAPEFGRMPGGQVSLATRGGTNVYHGTLFEYFRNEALDATDWFINSRGQEKPSLRQNQFGGTLGGPILFPRFGDGDGDSLWTGEDKAFFFFSYEGLRLLQPKTIKTQVPTLAVRQTAHPLISPFLNVYPLPNGPTLATNPNLAEYSAAWSDPSEYDNTALRLDYNVSEKHNIFGRFSYTPSFSGLRSNGLTVTRFTNVNNTSFTGGSTWLLSDRFANDLRVNFTTNDAPFRSEMDSFGGGTPLPASVFAAGSGAETSTFTLSVTGATSLSMGTGTAYKQRQFNIVDGLTISLKSHNIKLGLDYRRINPQLSGDSPRNTEGITVNPNDARLGFPRVSRYAITFGNPRPLAVAFDNFSVYAQDTWRVSSRLTLTYGLRWEYVPPPHSTEGPEAATLTNVNNPYGQQVRFNLSEEPLWRTRYNNFAPRFGASFLVSRKPDQELVVRGGFGIFHDLGFGSIATTYVQYPFTASRTCPSNPDCPGTTVPYPFASSITSAPNFLAARPSSFTTADPELRLPFVYQWNVAAERSFGAHQTLTVSWVGSEGRELLKFDPYRINLVEWPAPQSATSLSVLRNNGYSDYRALQVQFQRRLHRNFQSLIAYTLGRSRDTESSDGSLLIPSERSDLDLDYGYSNYDIRHVFTGALSFELPKINGGWFVRSLLNGWGIDSIFRLRTGLPVNPITETPFNDPAFPLTETLPVRPNVVPGEAFWISDPTAPGGRRLNSRTYSVLDDAILAAAGCLGVPRAGTPPPGVSYGFAMGAFCTPVANAQGNLPRGLIRGFGARQLDVSLRREFHIREKVKLRLKFDVFNVTNTPNFSDPIAQINLPSLFSSESMLGQGLGGLSVLYQIGGPRSVQLSAKLTF